MPHTRSSVERIAERTKEIQGVRRALDESVGAGGADALFKEFSEALDKIAARVNERIAEQGGAIDSLFEMLAVPAAQQAKPEKTIECGFAKSAHGPVSEESGEAQAGEMHAAVAVKSAAKDSEGKTSKKGSKSEKEDAQESSDQEPPGELQTKSDTGGAKPVEGAKTEKGADKQTAAKSGAAASSAAGGQVLDDSYVEALQTVAAEGAVDDSATHVVKMPQNDSAEIKLAERQSVVYSENLNALFTAAFLTGAPAAANLAANAQSEQSTAALGVKQTLEVSALKGLSGSSPQNQQGSFGGQHTAGKASEQARAERTAPQLPPQAAARAFERVESALKEAAKARDGKTISLRLDPPDLGTVKVDVSLREGLLHARLSADSASVSNLLREKAHELQSTLRKLGLAVDRVTVSIYGEDAAAHDLVDLENGQFFSAHENGGNGAENATGEWSGVPHSRTAQITAQAEAALDHWIA